MKKPEQKNKKKARDKVSVSGAQQSGSPEAPSPQQDAREGRSRAVQTPPRREGEKRKEEKSAIVRYVGIAGQFLKESRTELKKVKWPTKKELLASTAAVLVLVLIVSLYLGLIDFGLIKIIRSIVG